MEMNSNSEELRKRFETFARHVSKQAGRINTLIDIGQRNEAMRQASYLSEEASLHVRRLTGQPDNVDDSGEGPDGATDDFAIDLSTLNRDYGSDGRQE